MLRLPDNNPEQNVIEVELQNFEALLTVLEDTTIRNVDSLSFICNNYGLESVTRCGVSRGSVPMTVPRRVMFRPK